MVNTTSANPNIQPDASCNPSCYSAIDCANPNYGISGTISGTILEFTVITKILGEPPRKVSGQDFFAVMMTHFAGRIKAIRGVWIDGLDLDTNINTFNDLTKRGLSDVEAAKGTWTGKRATQYGFSNVKIEWKAPPGAHPGKYTEVRVLFS